MKGAIGATQAGSAPAKVSFVPVRLPDGSASFQIPQGWKHQSFGTGFFVAKDPSGFFSFMVAAAEAVTPQLGVKGKGLVVSPTFPLPVLSSFLPQGRTFCQTCSFF